MPQHEAEPLILVSVQEAEPPAPEWARGLEFCVPTSIFERWRREGTTDANGSVRLGPLTTVEPGEASNLRLRAAFTDRQPLSSRLPISYHWVPGPIRVWLAGLLGRRLRKREDRWASFPRWPLDLSADLLSDLAGERSPFTTSPTPVVLSHDLDSPEGVQNLVQHFLPREEQVGARSTNFVVPCAWPLDHGLLREISHRGHELGVHGYDHSNRTAFVSPIERHRRLSASKGLTRQYRMQGYRAPSLLRTRELLDDLGSMYRYDSSIPTSGGAFPVPNNGCASARPFHIGPLVELPLSLPRDGSLRFLGYDAAEIGALWIQSARKVAASGGVVVLLTHCEAHFSGNPSMLRAYDEFLHTISAAPEFTWMTAGEVVERFLALEALAGRAA